jgi:recombinational DNA repair ATPase RecF
MSELDPGRRERLVSRLAAGGQTLITAADEESLPLAARESLVRMPSPGAVESQGDSGMEAA